MANSDYWIIAGAIFAGLAVAFGAFGAHVLENRLDADALQTYETAVRYQMYHGLALLLIALLSSSYTRLDLTAWSFIAGIMIFSGSLYILVLTDTSWLGAITPIGGLAFLVGWANLAYQVFQQ
jgi:uncharacterized membrane protein YgdD (TMEM256/DUF423 family)